MLNGIIYNYKTVYISRGLIVGQRISGLIIILLIYGVVKAVNLMLLWLYMFMKRLSMMMLSMVL